MRGAIDPAPAFSHYDWRDGREAMLRVGPVDAPTVMIAPALFEEANRTRAFTLALMRALAGQGIASVLPDLPGQGESLWPTERATVTVWREAFAAAIEAAAPVVAVVAIRGGALVDTGPYPGWHLAPMRGEAISRDLRRLIATGRPQVKGEQEPVRIAGNLVGRSLLDELGADAAPPTERRRIVRLDTDPRPAGRKLPGVPLWRLAEPGNDLALATTLAGDIADWIASCAAS